jgi:hypothetical protein
MTSFPVNPDLIFTKVGGDPNNSADVLLHMAARQPSAIQASGPIKSMTTPDALPGTPVNPLPGPLNIVLAERQPSIPELEEPIPDIVTLTLPFQLVPGQVILGENGDLPDLMTVGSNGRYSQANWSDVVDFALGPNNTTIITMFSDPDIPSFCAAGSFVLVSTPTYPGSPHATVMQVPCPGPILSANAQGIRQIGPEGGNAGFYSPAANVNYTFISDVPEPSPLILLAGGLCALFFSRNKVVTGRFRKIG